jgi:hypothetical protein
MVIACQGGTSHAHQKPSHRQKTALGGQRRPPDLQIVYTGDLEHDAI